MTLNIEQNKLKSVIQLVYNAHKTDNATATEVIGLVGDTQIQIIATSENTFLIDSNDVSKKHLCISDVDPVHALLRDTIESSESLSLDDAEDRESLIKKLTDNLLPLLANK